MATFSPQNGGNALLSPIKIASEEETAGDLPASMVIGSALEPPTSTSVVPSTTTTTTTPSLVATVTASTNQILLPDPPSSVNSKNDVYRRIQGSNILVASNSPANTNIVEIFREDASSEDITRKDQNQNKKEESDEVSFPFYPSDDLNSPVVPLPECGNQTFFEEGRSPVIDHTPKTNEGVSYSQECTEDVDGRGSYLEGQHWRRGQIVGTGISGTCYMATDVQTNRVVVVKQMSLQFSNRDDIMVEVGIMNQLQHVSIIPFLGATRENTRFNIFMPWMKGGSMAERLKKGVFGEDQICQFSYQLVSGVYYLHSCGIAHRDLKGGNVLLDASCRSLRIADFGTAARLCERHKFEQVAGTPPFMAPEVVRAKPGQGYGLKCDIWSLGCVVIEMATGKPPWVLPGCRRWEILYKIGTSESPPSIPSSIQRESLKDFIISCLRLDPLNRPAAADLITHPLMLEQH